MGSTGTGASLRDARGHLAYPRWLSCLRMYEMGLIRQHRPTRWDQFMIAALFTQCEAGQ